MKTKRGSVVHQLIPRFESSDRFAADFNIFRPPWLYFTKMMLCYLKEKRVTLKKILCQYFAACLYILR
jgi:hypothetical protein